MKKAKGLEAKTLQTAVKSTPAQSQRACRLADISTISGKRLLDEKTLYVFEAHIFEPG
jgi:hypothetical protein